MWISPHRIAFRSRRRTIRTLCPSPRQSLRRIPRELPGAPAGLIPRRSQAGQLRISRRCITSTMAATSTCLPHGLPELPSSSLLWSRTRQSCTVFESCSPGDERWSVPGPSLGNIRSRGSTVRIQITCTSRLRIEDGTRKAGTVGDLCHPHVLGPSHRFPPQRMNHCARIEKGRKEAFMIHQDFLFLALLALVLFFAHRQAEHWRHGTKH